MRFSFLAMAAVAAAVAGCSGEERAEQNASVAAPGNVSEVAGQSAADGTIAQWLGGSADHARLVRALRAAGLEATLAGPGPYTLFAPTDAAFEKLPGTTADSLMEGEQKARLTSILTYHIVPGVVMAADLAKAVEAGGGKAVLATLGGGNLTVTAEDGTLVITDAKGGQGRVVGPDAMPSNGVVHSIDAVLMPS